MASPIGRYTQEPEWRVPPGGTASPKSATVVAVRTLTSAKPCDFSDIGRLRGTSSPPELLECSFDKRTADLEVENCRLKRDNAELNEMNVDLRSGLKGLSAANTKLERENAKLKEQLEALLSRYPEADASRAASV
jgi:hypothetical protein